MYYLKSLVINFLVVFFANHILPGIMVNDLTKLPHVGGDLIFAFALGLLNSMVYPVMKVLKHDGSAVKMAMVILILNFAAYAIVKMLGLGIQVMSVEGYLLVAVVVTVGSFVINFFEMKRQSHKSDLPL